MIKVLTNMPFSIIIRHKLSARNSMAPKYGIGQKIIIRPVKNQALGPRDCTIEPYAGQIGEVTDYYGISPRAGEAFYIYTVRVGMGYKEIALHEDEIEGYKKQALRNA